MAKKYTNHLKRTGPIYQAWLRQLEIQGHYNLLDRLGDDYFSPALSRHYRHFYYTQKSITNLILSS